MPAAQPPTARAGESPSAPAGESPSAPAGESPSAPAGESPSARAGESRRAEESPLTSRPLRAARAATVLAFFLTGAVFATWAARLPALTERLDLSPGGASLALAGVEAGALGGLAVAGRLVGALGSAKSLRLGYAAYPTALMAVALAPSLGWLVGAMAAMGVANSVIDVAMNVQGVELERRYARPLLSGLHSSHSFGVVAGGVAGALCGARAVPLAGHFAAVAGIALVASQLSIGALLTEAGRDAERDARPHDEGRREADRESPRARRRLVAIGLLASGAFFVEGAAGDWSAIELRAVHGAGPGLAGAAFTTFSLALALSRLGADRLVVRHGRARFVRAAASVAALGAGTVVVSGSAGVALLGWALVGVGIAGIAPTLLGAAPEASGVPSSVAIATVSAIGYGGSFAGAPVIGALASITSLPAALASLVVGAGAIALLARRVLGGGDRDGPQRRAAA